MSGPGIRWGSPTAGPVWALRSPKAGLSSKLLLCKNCRKLLRRRQRGPGKGILPQTEPSSALQQELSFGQGASSAGMVLGVSQAGSLTTAVGRPGFSFRGPQSSHIPQGLVRGSRCCSGPAELPTIVYWGVVQDASGVTEAPSVTVILLAPLGSPCMTVALIQGSVCL